MALAGQPWVLHPNDKEDVDFLDQLASDFSHGDAADYKMVEKEGILDNVLSKLSITGVTDENGGTDDGAGYMSSLAATNPVMGNHEATVEDKGGMLPASSVGEGDLDMSITGEAVGEAARLVDSDSLQTNQLLSDLMSYSYSQANRAQSLEPKELQWDMFNVKYVGGGLDAFGDFISDLDGVTNSESQPALQSGSQTFAPAANSSSHSDWNVESVNHAFHSFPAVHAVSEVDHSGSGMHENGVYADHQQPEITQEYQVPSRYSPTRFNGANKQPVVDFSIANEPGEIGLMSAVGDTSLSNYNADVASLGAHGVITEQKVGNSVSKSKAPSSLNSGVQSISLGSDSQFQGGPCTNNFGYDTQQQQQVAHSQVFQSMSSSYYGYPASNTSESMSSMYDYCPANTGPEWEQVRNQHVHTSSIPVENHIVGSGHSVSMTGTAASGPSASVSTMQIMEVPERKVLEQPTYTGSFWQTGQDEILPPAPSYSYDLIEPGIATGGLLASQQGPFYTDVPSRQQVQPVEHFPGWYTNGAGDGGFQQQAQWGDQNSGWYNQSQHWQQVTLSSSQPFESSNYGTTKPAVDSTQVWSYSLMPSEESTHLQEHSRVSSVNNEKNAVLVQEAAFDAWRASAVPTNLDDSLSTKAKRAQESFQLGNERSRYTPPSHSYGVSEYSNPLETQLTSVKQDMPLSDLPYSQQYTQSCNIYGTNMDMKQFTIERPSHALVTFGFGGRLVTMKASSNNTPEAIVVHDLNQVVLAGDTSELENGQSYFSSLNRGGLAGPITGGGVATKDVLKWVDDCIASCDRNDLHSTDVNGVRVLWSVLKIACLHFGRLRSSGLKSESGDGPEVELGRLLSTASSQNNQSPGVNASAAGMQAVPTGNQLQCIALEMKRSLLDGKRNEALQLAQQGQFWGPALVLAWQMGEKAYAETVMQMSQRLFLPGSPLRTLFLLFAGQTAELFQTTEVPLTGAAGPNSIGAYTGVKDSAGGMLGDWMGNLSIIAANPTNGDEQVITHLGDCLWKEYGKVAGAHTCYLVADAKFEPFSENARLCLAGADHFRWQRTFATPLAIQRTELYEHAKVLGNPQFVLLPFQPYKLLYAYMLVEAGKVSEARRYCQAVTKALKNVGRSSELEFCRQSVLDLDERLRLHSQGGYRLNAVTGKLVGKFIGTLDSTLHRFIGGGPPPRQASEPSLNKNPKDWYSSSQSMGPSASTANGATTLGALHVEARLRSVSEPNLSWAPMKNKETTSTSSQADTDFSKGTKSEPSRAGYLGRFGSQLISRAVGFIKPNRKEAKLGDTNKFYYNKELKRWVEEGAEETMEELAPAPPPITANFYSNRGNADTIPGAGTELPAGLKSTELPPLPPSANQFSARGRLHGVRSRYVDTFNKGGLPAAKSTESPIVPTVMVPPPTQFFMPVNNPLTSQNPVEAQSIKGASSAPSMQGSAYMGPNKEDMGAFWPGLSPSVSSMARDTSWSGDMVAFAAPEASIDPLNSRIAQSSGFPDGSDAGFEGASSLMKANAVSTQDPSSLPPPPVIESLVGAENSIFSKGDGCMPMVSPARQQGGILTDMQEVEL